ncbi:MAG: hypothetical protein KatS3mg111_1209 [Pirellulaceae bacterium]|nr:MAG: hypothetical protein KatS3mg111_1209 [Pirellulaceae bacterium]
MQAVHLAIATIPLAIYLILIGALRLRRRPLVTSGWRDLLTLAIACSGLVVIGPMQLFFPTRAAAIWQSWVWLPLFMLYVLLVLLILMASKPRLIAYGLDDSQFREMLLRVARQVDPAAHWAGNVLNLPTISMQLAQEATGTPRICQVQHMGPIRNIDAWIQLERQAVRAAQQMTCRRSAAGWSLVICGCLLLAFALLPLLNDPRAALTQLRELINR